MLPKFRCRDIEWLVFPLKRPQARKTTHWWLTYGMLFTGDGVAILSLYVRHGKMYSIDNDYGNHVVLSFSDIPNILVTMIKKIVTHLLLQYAIYPLQLTAMMRTRRVTINIPDEKLWPDISSFTNTQSHMIHLHLAWFTLILQYLRFLPADV